MTCPGACRSSPFAVMPLGQWTISGVEIPPSWTHVLCRRNGVLHRLDQPGPMLRNVAPVPHSACGSWPSPRTMISALAPLSERKKMSVFSIAIAFS